MSRTHTLGSSSAIALVLAVTIAIAAVGPVTAATATTTQLPIDPLERQASDYGDDSPVTAEYEQINASLTVSESSVGVGLDRWRYSDAGKTYMRLQYHEGVDRRLRIPIPESLAIPRPHDELEATRSDLTADLERIDDHMVMIVDVSQPVDAVWDISTVNGGLFEIKDRGRDFIENQTGVPIPSVAGSSGGWSIVSDLQPHQTYRIQHNETDEIAVQYDSLNGTDRRWAPVDDCADGQTDICVVERATNATTTTILADTDHPPAMRWKRELGPRDHAEQAYNDIRTQIDRVKETFDTMIDKIA